MKSAHAKKHIGNLMRWDDARATAEFQWLDMMVNYKFDRYQGYGPGYRFYLSLLRWLNQFQPDERETAYELLRSHIVYITQAEMHHLVSRSGAIFERLMRRFVAKQLKMPVYEVDESDAGRRRMKLLQARTLYVGVSDGARIDVFRRFNEGLISNEQVVAMPDISDSKWSSLHKELDTRLREKGLSDEEPRFEWVCLIDDFTGSSFSSIRCNDEGVWSGKVGKFVAECEARTQHKLMEPACILVHHYLASQFARDTIVQHCQRIGQVFPHLLFDASFADVLLSPIKLQAAGSVALKSLIESHYDGGIEDVHKGKDLYYGYRSGGLPLVLEHNTPNNSVALLWAYSEPNRPVVGKKMSALFPRRQRHFEEK